MKQIIQILFIVVFSFFVGVNISYASPVESFSYDSSNDRYELNISRVGLSRLETVYTGHGKTIPINYSTVPRTLFIACNGNTNIKFIGSGGVVSHQQDFASSSIQNDTCASNDPSPPPDSGGGSDSGSGGSDGGSCDICKCMEIIGDGMKGSNERVREAVSNNGKKLDSIDDSIGNMNNNLGKKLDGVTSAVNDVTDQLITDKSFKMPKVPGNPSFTQPNMKTSNYKDNKKYFEDNGHIGAPGEMPTVPEPKDWNGVKKEDELKKDDELNKDRTLRLR